MATLDKQLGTKQKRGADLHRQNIWKICKKDNETDQFTCLPYFLNEMTRHIFFLVRIFGELYLENCEIKVRFLIGKKMYLRLRL